MLDDSIKASLAQASKQHLLSLIEAQRKKLQSLDAIHEALGDGQMTRAELVERIAELERAADNALGVLLACCVPAEGVDDRAAILDAQRMLRAAMRKEGGE